MILEEWLTYSILGFLALIAFSTWATGNNTRESAERLKKLDEILEDFAKEQRHHSAQLREIQRLMVAGFENAGGYHEIRTEKLDQIIRLMTDYKRSLRSQK